MKHALHVLRLNVIDFGYKRESAFYVLSFNPNGIIKTDEEQAICTATLCTIRQIASLIRVHRVLLWDSNFIRAITLLSTSNTKRSHMISEFQKKYERKERILRTNV